MSIMAMAMAMAAFFASPRLTQLCWVVLLWLLPEISNAATRDADDGAVGTAAPEVAPEDAAARSYVSDRGGYVHPRLFVGTWGGGATRGVGVVPDTGGGAVEGGTLLFRVPWSIVAEAEDDCVMARFLARELRRHEAGGASAHGRYLAEVVRIQDRQDFLAPRSDDGADYDPGVHRELLQGLPPSDFDRHAKWLEHACGFGDPSGWDAHARRALDYVVSYGTNEGLIPYYDLVNNHRGLRNVRLHLTADALEVYASRAIRPGEQLYTLYRHDLTTGEVWRDYGYIEEWPRWWTFEVEKEIDWFWGWFKTTTLVRHEVEVLPGNIVIVDPRRSEAMQDDDLTTLADWKGYASANNARISDEKMSSFKDAAIQFLANLPTTIETDEKLLASFESKDTERKGIHGIYGRVIEYRLQYKKDIQATIEAVDAILKGRGRAGTANLDL